VLEEAGLKIDYIEEQVGSVVGLYASGYTATQIDSIFNRQILMN
jgi:NTE family protein